jgi:hypothetical protein
MNGEGDHQDLINPILQLQGVLYWQEMKVWRLADETRDYRACKSNLEKKLKYYPSIEQARKLCDGPYVCTHLSVSPCQMLG